jgi:hypothetical protein
MDGNGDLLVNGSGVTDGRGGALVLKCKGDTGHEQWRIASEIAVSSVLVTNASDSVYLAGSTARGYRPGPIAPPFSGPDTGFAMSKLSGEARAIDWTRSFDGGHHDTDWAEKLVLATDGNPVPAGFTPDDARFFGCVQKMAE